MAAEFEIWFYFRNEYTLVYGVSLTNVSAFQFDHDSAFEWKHVFASRAFQTLYCRCIDEMRTLVQVSKFKHNRCRCCGSRMLRQERQTLRSSASQTTANHLPNNFQAAKGWPTTRRSPDNQEQDQPITWTDQHQVKVEHLLDKQFVARELSPFVTSNLERVTKMSW